MNQHSNNTNTLLVEIMIAVLFFALCTTVLLQSFAKIHQAGELSGAGTSAMIEARSLMERLNTSQSIGEAEETLASAGYTQEGEHWTLRQDRRSCSVTVASNREECGTLFSFRLTAAEGETGLFTLNGASYAPGEVQ